MSERFDLSDPEQREAGLAAAVAAVRRGQLVVLPTDTVYGLGVDAFDAEGVQRLLDAKGRGRDMPPPVLVSAATTLEALATELPAWAEGLVERFWPGPLTLVCRQQPSLRWDLGESRGTVAVRMPDDEGALELLGRTGPMAVSSANLTGHPASTDADAAEEMLGDAVEVVLDGGPSAGAVASTIVDCTGERPVVLREGAIDRAVLAQALEELGTTLSDGDDAPGGGTRDDDAPDNDAPDDDAPDEHPGEANPADDHQDDQDDQDDRADQDDQADRAAADEAAAGGAAPGGAGRPVDGGPAGDRGA
ncbi:MAG: threonylcarbamoyl-AMP synthase [Marmoricola sp.]|nr:threonylcarbamoyl-AMP synthase [Marmoricola sp.]